MSENLPTNATTTVTLFCSTICLVHWKLCKIFISQKFFNKKGKIFKLPPIINYMFELVYNMTNQTLQHYYSTASREKIKRSLMKRKCTYCFIVSILSCFFVCLILLK